MATQEEVNEAFLLAVQDSDLKKINRLFSPFRFGKKPDINATDKKGQPALMWAVTRDNPDILMFLVEKGVDLNQQNSNGETAVYHAVKTKSSGNLQRLWEQGANINTPNKNGVTPLMNALRSGDEDDALYLILRKADILRVDNEGNSALIYAARHGRIRTVIELMDKYNKSGMSQKGKDKEIRKAYYFAKLSKNTKIMTELDKHLSKIPIPRYKHTKKKVKQTLADKIQTVPASELMKMAQSDKIFTGQVVAMGLLLVFMEKLSYEERKDFYRIAYKNMTEEQRKIAQHSIRQARPGGVHVR